MKRFYITNKKVNEFIETSLKRFDSLETFRSELERVVSECDESSKNQKRFYEKVLIHLN
jgi:hypothetical protein